MDKYEELIAVFSETLKQSKGLSYCLYMYQSGLCTCTPDCTERDSTQNNSMKIDGFFILRKKWRIVCCVIGAGNGFIRIESC